MGEIVGGPGNDTLYGSGSGDVMRGLDGDDTYVIVHPNDQAIETENGGNDIVYATIDHALTQGSSIETLSAIDWSQTNPLSLTGNGFANFIYGNAGANFLNGGGGADVMVGFGGDDVYIVDDAGDAVNESAGQGSDLVYALTSWQLTANSSVETLSAIDWSATNALSLTGNGFANTLYGNAGANFLNGGGGADAMFGFGGDDVYIVDNAGDAVNESAGQGNDLVYALADYALTQGSSIETLSAIDWSQTSPLRLTGNGFANFIYGNAGANFLNGGGGADAMFGFGGDDVYIADNAGDAVNESAGQGNDLVYALADYALTQGSSVETLSAIDWSQTSPLSLTGNGFANVIYGNAGANFLNGGGGADAMFGFGGDDVYIVDNAGDAVNESAGQGNDLVYALADYALTQGSSIETLSAIDWSQTSPLSLTGNGFANTLYGNAGANFLNGGGGADAMFGFGGDDVYIADNAGDAVNESAGQGNDLVYALADYALTQGSSVETLSAIDWSQTNPLNLTGNGFANTLYGNAGANFLNGGGGADAMFGFGGDDVYVVDDAGDAVNEASGQGNDTVYALADYTLTPGSSVETLSAIDWSQTNPLNLTGNGLANIIYGNAGANVLNGGDGADTMTGFGGADSFAFTTALGGSNVDTVVDFQAGVDKIILAGGQGDPFASLATGALAAGSFLSASPDPYAGAGLPPPGSSSQIAAMDGNDYILYNRSSGALLYDADGNGAGAAVQFATLQPGLNLTAADFIVSGPANNAPTVTSGAGASIAENSPASTIVYQATASDADGDRITWSLTGADAGLLTIDAVTGAVRLITSADFETKASYSFNVVASDSGSSTPKAVALTITDVADSSTPIINETSSPNDAVASAQVIDRSTLMVASNPNLVNGALPSATIVGNVSTHTDKDFFAITLQAGEQLILDVDINPANGFDSFLTLYGPNGVVIGDNDDLVSPDPGSGTQFNHNTDSQIIFRAATTGTYYFSISAFDDDDPSTTSDDSFGDYKLNVSVGPPATPQQLIQEDIQALQSGTMWNHLALTYGFPTLASQYPASFTEPDNGFTPFSSTQQDATRLLLQIVGSVTQLTFAELTSNPGQADLRYAMSNEADVAYAYYPTNGGPSSLGGTAWFNHTNFNSPTQGNYAWMGILHETGHTLGLKHGHEFPQAISADRDSVEYSVMTYRSYPGQDLSGGGGYTNETWSYAQTLMMYDIAALQQIYGNANYGFNAGDSVYTWNPNTGQMLINGGIGTTPGGNRILLTVWDGGGNDTYDLSNYTAADTIGTTIDLRPGEWTTTSQIQIANLGQGHFARGNIANALLYQGNPASLIENAIGSQTTDTIIANQAANHLTGNGGADTFKWMASTDAGTGSQADTIMDFVSGTDHIDLSAIDANPGTGSDDVFTFIGTSAFHNVAGELRYDVTGGSAHIFADLDGNGVADFEIVVNNVTTLAGTDFFL